jgi:hypothetical protein
MKKLLMTVVLSLFCTPVLATQYQCSVARSNGTFTKGVITDNGDSVSFTTFDNKDSYTSGSLFALKTNSIRLKSKEMDNVAYCTNVATTATEDNLGNKEFQFQNTVSGDSVNFYNCEEFEQPPAEEEEEACDVPLPEPAVCPATEPKKIGEPVPPKDKKPAVKKPQKPKNPFDKDKKPKPKSKMPTPDNMCPV